MLNTDIKFFDAYHIKKIWPKLIMATILVQFSFLLSGLLVDIGNILGAGIGDLLTANLSSSSADLGNLIGNLVTGAVGASVSPVAVL